MHWLTTSGHPLSVLLYKQSAAITVINKFRHTADHPLLSKAWLRASFLSQWRYSCFCVFCVFEYYSSLLRVWLSVAVQLIHWEDSSL